MYFNYYVETTTLLQSQRCFNVETTTSEKLSKSNINSTLLQRYVTTLFQRRYYDVGKTFKTEYKFNVETTLRHDVVTTLLQRQCVYWEELNVHNK